jgi:hypothetical protein
MSIIGTDKVEVRNFEEEKMKWRNKWKGKFKWGRD